MHTWYGHFRKKHKDAIATIGWVSMAESVRTAKGHPVQGIFCLSYPDEFVVDVVQPQDEPEEIPETEAMGCGSRKHHNL